MRERITTEMKIEQTPSIEAVSVSPTLEISRILWNEETHFILLIYSVTPEPSSILSILFL